LPGVLIGVVTFVAVVAFALAVLRWAPGFLGATSQTATTDARDKALAVLAGAGVTAGVVVSGLTYRLSRSGQVTDRLTKAIEQLANDNRLVVLGGIYALERIAYDSRRDHSRVMEVLTAYVRHTAQLAENGQQGPPDDRVDLRCVPTDQVQAVLAVLKRRRSAHDEFKLDLRSAALRGAKLPKADLRGALQIGTVLSTAINTVDSADMELLRADLSDADLRDADLRRADLTGADLRRAKLQGTDLTGATLDRAQLQGASADAQTKPQELWGWLTDQGVRGLPRPSR